MAQAGIAYELLGPDGTRVVFNDPTDTDFCGYLDAETGIQGLLDTGAVRGSMEDLVEGDGGIAVDTYLARRTGTLEGILWPDPDPSSVNSRESRLKRATRALRGTDWAYLRWTQDGRGVQTQLPVRRQEKVAITARRPKRFQVSLETPNAFVEAAAESSQVIVPGNLGGETGFSSPLTSPLTSVYNVAGSVYVTNVGDAPAWPRFRIDGPVTNPRIRNETTGQELRLTYTLIAGEYLIVDTKDATIKLAGTADRYSAYDFVNSTWWQLQPRSNDIRFLPFAYSSGAQLTVLWRHTWE